MIGAPKAGTTTLAADLAAHPALWLPARKELGYFDIRWRDEPVEAYSADFAPAPADCLVGEATPSYLHYPGAVERIAECVPEVRLVVVLRDPVDRAWSHYWYNREARLVEDRPPAEVLTPDSLEYIRPGRYVAHLRRVLDVFDRDQLHVLTLDEMVEDPSSAFRGVCRHLGVEELVPVDAGRARNQAYAVRSPWVRRQMFRFRVWERLPFHLGFRIDELNRKPLDVPPIPEELRASIEEWYAEDTAQLGALLGRRLPWSSGRRSSDDPAETA